MNRIPAARTSSRLVDDNHQNPFSGAGKASAFAAPSDVLKIQNCASQIPTGSTSAVQQIVNTYYVNFYGRWPNECDCVSYILRETGRETLTRGGPENGVGSKERDPTSEW